MLVYDRCWYCNGEKKPNKEKLCRGCNGKPRAHSCVQYARAPRFATSRANSFPEPSLVPEPIVARGDSNRESATSAVNVVSLLETLPTVRISTTKMSSQTLAAAARVRDALDAERLPLVPAAPVSPPLPASASATPVAVQDAVPGAADDSDRGAKRRAKPVEDADSLKPAIRMLQAELATLQEARGREITTSIEAIRDKYEVRVDSIRKAIVLLGGDPRFGDGVLVAEDRPRKRRGRIDGTSVQVAALEVISKSDARSLGTGAGMRYWSNRA